MASCVSFIVITTIGFTCAFNLSSHVSEVAKKMIKFACPNESIIIEASTVFVESWSWVGVFMISVCWVILIRLTIIFVL